MSLRADVEAALRRHLTAVEEALAGLSHLDGLHAQHRRDAESSLAEAVAALAAAALPAADDEAALAAAARALQLSSLEPSVVRATVDEQRRSLQERQRQLLADDRLRCADERVAQLEERARELVEPTSHLRQSVRALEQDKDFRQFLAGRDDKRWWTFSFHSARNAGERAFARHGEKRRCKDAEALAQKHLDEREALATLEGELTSAAAEHAALKELVAEHAKVTAALVDVAGAVLEELRASVRSCLQHFDDDDLLSRFPAPPGRAHARWISGARARARYLEASFAHYIDRTRREILGHLQDVALVLREGAGASRRGAGDTAAEVEANTRERLRDIDEKARLYRSTAERLLAFTRWDEHDPRAGDLWWDAFTDGRGDGSFIDEVAWHRTMGRPRGPHLQASDSDPRAGWAHNADRAMAALAAAHAEHLSEKAGSADVDAASAGESASELSSEGTSGAVPAPVVLPDHGPRDDDLR